MPPEIRMLVLFLRTRETLSSSPWVIITWTLIISVLDRMSGELGFYDIVVGNQGDRNDLALWFKGGSLVSTYA